MKILFYDDMPAYGGHQVMTALGIEACAHQPSWEVVAAVSQGNEKNAQRLSSIKAVRLARVPFVSRKFEGLRNRFDGAKVRQLADWLSQEKPALVVAVQGDIEGSSLVLLAAKKAGLPCASYIPVPHDLATMGAKLGRFRDPFNRYLFDLPTCWLTISEGMAILLRARGAKQPIHVVENGVDVSRLQHLPEKREARRRLSLDEQGVWVGLVGRVEFKQKQQDFAVTAWPTVRDTHPQARLAIIGSGPDDAALDALIAASGCRESITRLPWQQDTSLCYAALDALAIPSRFEGVPLVMLEALAAGLPVVGANRDGMADYLPEAWRFEAGDASGMARALREALSGEPTTLSRLRQRVCERNNLEAFQSGFVSAVAQCLPSRA